MNLLLRHLQTVSHPVKMIEIHQPHHKEEIVGECADLLYHTLVLLADAGVKLSDVCTELKDRH